MKRLVYWLLLAAMLLPIQVAASPQPKPVESVSFPNGPRWWFEHVQRDEFVRIRVENFPQSQNFRVTMGLIGASFDPVRVGKLSGSLGDSFAIEFPIPSRFHRERFLALQVENTSSGAFTYNIFMNNDDWNEDRGISLTGQGATSSDSAGSSATVPNGPSFWIHDVVMDTSVTIKVVRYPHGNEKYKVIVGKTGIGNEISGGQLMGTITQDNGRYFTFKVPLPSRVLGDREFFVRLENPFTLDYAFTVVTNNDDWQVQGTYQLQGESSGVSAFNPYAKGFYSGHPYTQILDVIEDTEVTLQVINAPADDAFTVTMGAIGSAGINGIVIGTQTTGAGGSFVVTYPIPDSLKGSDQIAIRLQSPTSGFFAYDFFNNSDGNVP